MSKRSRTGQILKSRNLHEYENCQNEADTSVHSDGSDTESVSEGNVTSSVETHATSPVAGITNRYSEYFDVKMMDKIKTGICKLCSLRGCTVAIKMKQSNTTGLKSHLKSKHKAAYDRLFPACKTPAKSQLTLENMMPINKNKILSPDALRFLTVEWISTKLLSLNFFDDPSTQVFFKTISPNYEFPRRTALTRDMSRIYEQVRKVVIDNVRNNTSKISFTVDGWTSIRTKSYYGITLHFITDDWKMLSLALDFIPVKGCHTGLDIATIFSKSLEKSNLENKIAGITVDNASVNSVFLKELERLLVKKDIRFNAEEQHFHCIPHVLNLAVQDIFKVLRADNVDDNPSSDDDDENEDDLEVAAGETVPPIAKLRELCKKLKKSEKLQIKLEHCCKISEEIFRNLPLDVCTRWNSSYTMITAGLRMKKAISALAKTSDDLHHLYVSEQEWTLLSQLQHCLFGFKKLSETLSGCHYATLPSVIGGINVLLDNIESLCHELDVKDDRNSTDEIIIHALQAARDKILKHYQKTNWTYCAVLILDPRHKLKGFDKTSWGKELKDASYEYFKGILKTEYADVADEICEESEQEEEYNTDDDYTRRLKALYGEEKQESTKWERELDNYLSLKRCDVDQNILDWWRDHQTIFPRLAKMARDLLSICASSVPVEQLFSKAGLLLRKQRSRLSDENIEKLLCLNSWFRSPLAVNIKKVILSD